MNILAKEKKISPKKILVIIALFAGAFFLAMYMKERAGQNKPSSASIISQDENAFQIKLALSNNGRDEKSANRYAVLLFKTDGSGKRVGESPIDYNSYPDSIILGGSHPKSSSQEISYVAPDYLSGKYDLVVDYFDEAGSWPNSLDLGTVDLQGKENNFLEILSEKCILQANDNPDISTLTQGIDVKAEENLIITCPIRNYSDKEMTIQPNFENFRRNYLLGEAASFPQTNYEKISISGGQTKNISLSIPKSVIPQAYDASLYFTDASNRIISNKIFAHYIIYGESATVRNVTLDKDSYDPEEPANLEMSYFGSADGFDYSRLGGTRNEILKAQIDIKNQSGESCLSEKEMFDLDPKKNIAEFALDIAKTCQDPLIEVSLIGKDDHLLDQRTFLKEAK